MKDETETQVDWQQKTLELQIQVEQLNSKLRDSVEMARLFQFYISQLQQERETATVATANKLLQTYKEQNDQEAQEKKQEAPSPS